MQNQIVTNNIFILQDSNIVDFVMYNSDLSLLTLKFEIWQHNNVDSCEYNRTKIYQCNKMDIYQFNNMDIYQ